MKRLLSLLLCAVLALFCATTAQAAGVSHHTYGIGIRAALCL